MNKETTHEGKHAGDTIYYSRGPKHKPCITTGTYNPTETMQKGDNFCDKL